MDYQTPGLISGIRISGIPRWAPTSQLISSSSLGSHGSDQLGHDAGSPMDESSPVVPQESMVESSGTEEFCGRHYRFRSGRQWRTVEGRPFRFPLHTVTVTSDARIVGWCGLEFHSALFRPGGDVAPYQWVGAQCSSFDAWQSRERLSSMREAFALWH